MDADGSNQVRLTNSVSSDTNPAWSPDGTKIAFARGGGDKNIFVMDADGSNPEQLTIASGHDMKPDWQPDNTAPEPPVFLRSDPGQPRIIGTAEDESTVHLYRDAQCSGEVSASGPASEFVSRGLPVTTLADGEHTFYGTATDLPGHVSECSPDAITYVRDTSAAHGEHVLVVRSTDVAGNVEDSPAQRRFLHRPPECSNLWIPLPGPLPSALPGPDSVCA